MGSCTQALSILSRVWKLYSSFEYFESSMESGTQAMSILSRVWKAVLKL